MLVIIDPHGVRMVFVSDLGPSVEKVSPPTVLLSSRPARDGGFGVDNSALFVPGWAAA